MTINKFWTNMCLKIGFTQFWTNWCPKIGFGQIGGQIFFGQFWTNSCLKYVFGSFEQIGALKYGLDK